MFDTQITVVGTALTTPERRVTERTNTVVTSFRVVSNARRFDRETNQWVDGANLRIKVTCWRRLAQHVVDSIVSGDPVIVQGRIATREWKNEQGEARLSYEIDASSVGHDLSRGTAKFTRVRGDGLGSVIEDADSDNRVNGELTRPAPLGPSAEESYDQAYATYANETAEFEQAPAETEALAILREAGLDPRPEDDELVEDGEAELVGAAAGSGGSGGRGRRRGR